MFTFSKKKKNHREARRAKERRRKHVFNLQAHLVTRADYLKVRRVPGAGRVLVITGRYGEVSLKPFFETLFITFLSPFFFLAKSLLFSTASLRKKEKQFGEERQRGEERVRESESGVLEYLGLIAIRHFLPHLPPFLRN